MIKRIIRLSVFTFSLSMVIGMAHVKPVTDGPVPPCFPCTGGGGGGGTGGLR